MSKEQLSSLITQRATLKSQLTRTENTLKSINSKTDLESLDLEGRLTAHLTLWDRFSDIQNQVESIADKNPENTAAHESERVNFESRFYVISGTIKKHLKKLQNDSASISTESRRVAGNGTDEGFRHNSTFHLPKLEAPTFNGSFDTWLSFYDSFKSMCHDNSAIPTIQKFHYLKACLKGDAAEIIASLETSTENYTVAWNLLKQRYNNKKFIIDTHLKALFDIPCISKEFSKKHPFQKERNSQNNSRSPQTCMTSTTSEKPKITLYPCVLCSGSHALSTCAKFLGLSQNDRYNKVKQASICHNCFYSNHRTIDCKKSPCQKCQKKHHVLLHFEKASRHNSQSNQSNAGEQIESNSSGEQTEIVQSNKISFQSSSQVLLGTALIDVLDNQGKYRTCRALLDSGSQCNAISEKCVSQLGLTRHKSNIQLQEVENLRTTINYCASTLTRSRTNDTQNELMFLVFKNISSRLPSISIDQTSFSIPNEVILADPEFYKSADIDLLLGAECFYNMLGTRKIRLKGLSISLRETDLGWIVVGSISQSHDTKSRKQTSCNFIEHGSFPLLWEMGQENSSNKFLSKQKQECEKHFVQNTVRKETGKYAVNLPFNDKKHLLGNSRNTALQRLYSMERRFDREPELKLQYVACMQDYLDQGHMTLVTDNSTRDFGYYLPHQAVVKQDSLTTKVRVVFDASAKTTTGLSLNDTLMIGATVQQDLFSIVAHFRIYQFALTADIKQMYRQVEVKKEDRQFQKILWRKNPNEPILTYTLNTVTFGTACAPFLATRTLKQLAEDESKKFPKASQVIKDDFYVDDCLTGEETAEKALNLHNDLVTVLTRGGFSLRKWGSNSQNLLNKFSEKSSDSHMVLDLKDTIKTLGLRWDAITDSIFYTTNLETDDKCTKRSILSQTAKLFDPQGLLGPIIIVAKILIQDIWKTQLGWDDVVPTEIKNRWLEFQKELPVINQLRIPRRITIPDTVNFQLHGFSDASEKGYGACFYLRCTNKDGCHHTALICAKSRVAPLKIVTLPRLELCAANLLVHLGEIIKKALRLQFEKIIYWTDSTIVLNWINTSPHILKTFVANRIADIQNFTEANQWNHVPTQENPSDFISRGQNPVKFLENNLWFRGPSWLRQDSSLWPAQSFVISDLPEKRSFAKRQ